MIVSKIGSALSQIVFTMREKDFSRVILAVCCLGFVWVNGQMISLMDYVFDNKSVIIDLLYRKSSFHHFRHLIQIEKRFGVGFLNFVQFGIHRLCD